QFVVDALSRIGKMDAVTVEPCLPSEASYGYRNKAMPVLSMREGHFISGIYEPRSHKLVPYQQCAIQADALNGLIQKTLHKIDLAGLTPYQEKKHEGFLRHLAVRQGAGTGEMLLAFVTRTQYPEERLHKPSLLPEPLADILPRLAQELMAEVPGLVGVLQNVNPSRTNIVFGPATEVLAGRDHYFEKLDGLTLKVSLKSFLQVNSAQAEVLHTVVREALGVPEDGRKKWGTVLDLYSGIGTLALAVAEKADYVVGAEEVAPAVEDARENAALNRKGNLDFLEGDVAEMLLRLKAQGLAQIDAAILDPPRKGVLPEVLSRVTAFHPRRLVYVSCDPTTLARDLALLAKHGYAVDWAQPLDMFPQTYHVETVVRLTRTAPLPQQDPAALKEGLEPFRLPKGPEVSMNAQGASRGLGWWARALGEALGARLAGLFQKKEGFQWPLAEMAEAPSEAAPVSSNPEALPADGTAGAPGTAALPAAMETADPAPSVPVLPDAGGPPRRRFFSREALAFPWSARTTGLALLTLFLLAGGGYWAAADLSPLIANGSFQSSSIPQFIPDTIAIMPTRNFLRYEMVPFEVRIHPEDMPHFASMHAVVEVFHDGQPVSMVDGRTRLYLKKDPANARFIGNWPIPYNPVPGTYTAQIALTGPQWPDPKEFESAFTISPLKPSGLYPGYSALTMEGGKHLINGAVPPVDGRGGDSAANAIGWAKFMGANTYCFLAGQTSVWDKLNPKDFPFNRGDLALADRYGAAAHDAGIKFAAYMTTFRVVGDGWQQAADRYHFTLGYDPATDQVVPTDFVSLEDPTRRQDILALLRQMDHDPNIDMIGLDYVRTGTGGYEFVDEFVRDLNVPGPADYWSMSKDERIHWLARTVERRENKDVVALFEWWRAHKVAMTLKSILDEAKLSKPVFTFTLGWDMGHQHGQDPAMFEDAGVNFNHIMLYQSDRKTIEQMNRQWPPYIARSNGMYALGEMVDENWVQNSLDPPGPEELYDREAATFRAWHPVNAGLGMFWHDLYRILYGQKGYYSSMEWALAGAKSFSMLQQAEGTLPLEVQLSVPAAAPEGAKVPLSVEIHNHSVETLTGIVLHQIDTSKDYDTDLATVGPFDIP
ncbi:MAG TPA: 23S rRNA (uracil(1939)-C(5))-methyltransferase RlmD, partial [bacterium]|nr:23S rRNA (uracil(1939)-C(5))-methyltransferase RlmD [bacterium]